MQKSPRPAPWRTLLALGAAALAAHLALLSAAPVPFAIDGPRWSRPLVTRTIEAPAVAASTVPVAASPPRQTAVRTLPRAVPRTERSVTPPVAAVVEPPAEAATIPDSAPVPLAAASAPSAPESVAAAPDTAMPMSNESPLPPTASASSRAPQTAASAIDAAYAIPGSVRLNYSVSGRSGVQPMSGVTAELLWLHDGERYEARLAFNLFFSTRRSQTSTGRITREGLAPERFTDRRRSEVAAHFERDKGRISFSTNSPAAPLEAGAQDRLSVFFQLASMLAGSSGKLAQGTQIAVQTAGPRDAETWVFEVGASERLELPVGPIDAVKLVREPRGGSYSQKVEAWFAPSLGWVPVRLRVTDANGDMADQQLRTIATP